jgi:hypothetical protein
VPSPLKLGAFRCLVRLDGGRLVSRQDQEFLDNIMPSERASGFHSMVHRQVSAASLPGLDTSKARAWTAANLTRIATTLPEAGLIDCKEGGSTGGRKPTLYIWRGPEDQQ